MLKINSGKTIMKTTLKISIFILAFSIGIILPILTELRKAETSFSPINVVNKQKEVKSEIVKSVEIKKQPIFEVEDVRDFSDDNKALLEIGWDSYCDTDVKSGDSWFGLYTSNGKYVLNPTKLSVRTQRDEEYIWKEISIRNKNEPMFLVKNLKNLKKGKVKTLFHNYNWRENYKDDFEATTIDNEFIKSFSIGENNYTLRVKEGFSESEEPIMVLVLEDGNTSQIIGSAYNAEDNYVGYLNWAGDLDNDGKLDFFMEYYLGEKCAYASALFLSSEAEDGNLVKKFGFSNAP